MKKISHLNSVKTVGFIAISAVLIIGVYFLLLDLPKNENTSMDINDGNLVQSETTALSNPLISDQNTDKNTTVLSDNIYRDGSYTASQTYKVPGNQSNTLTAIIEIEKDTIVNVSTSSSHDSSSEEYNLDFEAGIEKEIVGKKIDNLLLSVVGGASLTSEAFNLVIGKIKDLSTNR